MDVGDFIRICVKTIELPRQPINWTPSVTWDQQGWWRKSLLFHPPGSEWAPLVAQMVKHLPAMQETRVGSLGWEHALEKEIGTHSSALAWKIPWMEEPGRLQSMGLQRVRHYWVTSLSLFWMQPWTSQSPRLTATCLSLSHTFRNVWQKSDSWKAVNMPGGSKGKMQCKRPRFNCWVGKIPWRREWLPTLLFLHGEFRGRKSLVGYSPWGRQESELSDFRFPSVNHPDFTER